VKRRRLSVTAMLSSPSVIAPYLHVAVNAEKWIPQRL